MRGEERVATFLLALPEGRADLILSRLTEEEIEYITRTIVNLGSVSPDAAQHVMEDFLKRINTLQPLKGSWDHAERLLANVLPPDRMTVLKSQIQGEQTLWKEIPKIPVPFFAANLLKESHQTIAIILQHIPSKEYVARILAEFESSVALSVVRCMIDSPIVDQNVMSSLEASLRQQLGASESGPDRFEMIADILGSMTRAQEKNMLDGLGQANTTYAERVKSFLFNFEDLKSFDGPSIQKLIKNIDKGSMAIAVKGASEDIYQLFLSQMSTRGGKLLEEEIKMLTNIRAKEIEEAQTQIAQIAKRMLRAGEIQLPIEEEKMAS